MSSVTSFLDAAHHDGSALYVSNQHPELGDTVEVRLRIPAETNAQGGKTQTNGLRLRESEPEPSVWLRAVQDGEPVRIQARLVSEDANERWYAADLTIHNPVVNYRWILVDGDGYRWVTDRGVFDRDVSDAGDFRITTHPAPPDWTSRSVVYQIFPDRFARSEQANGRPTPEWAIPAYWAQPPSSHGTVTGHELYGGDLTGIVEHLDYLADLGVNTIYLTPFFPAGSVHRYDANSFGTVDPLLGGNQALADLTAAIHERGMRIIGDITTNHTGVNHGWMQMATQDPESAEHGFYYWYGSDDAPLPTTGQTPRVPFVSWLGVSTLPKLNWTSDELRRRMITGSDSVIGKWLLPPYGLDGWRIDVANMTGRYRGHNLTHQVAKQIVQTVRELNPDGLVVAEHFHDAAGDLTGDGWISNMNYSAFTKPLWAWISDTKELDFLGVPATIPRRSGKLMVETMREFDSAYPWTTKIQLWNMLGSHDTPRIRTVTGSTAAVEVAAAMLFTYPGVPAFFMGDEGGFTAVTGEAGRKTMPWGEITTSSPVADGASELGSSSESGGTSDIRGTSATDATLASGIDQPKREEPWDTTLHDAFRALIKLHQLNDAFQVGGMRWTFAADNAVGYLRETAEQRLLVVLAREPWEGITLPGYLATGSQNGELPQALYAPRLARQITLNHDGRSLMIGGEGPGIGIWEL